MFQGQLLSIHVAASGAMPMQSVESAEAVPGQGLRGDRYFTGDGTFSKPAGDTDVTLIEIEAIEAAARDHRVAIEPGDARRNLVTRDVPLNHLVGREFHVGEVKLLGVRLCEPCAHLERLTKLGVNTAFAHRGGLRAKILSAGTVRAGDRIF